MLAGPVLTFDFAAATGYCWGVPGEVPRFASHHFPLIDANFGRHAANVRAFVRRTIFEIQPVMIGYESPVFPQKTTPATIRKLGIYGVVLEEECLREHLNVPVREIHVGSNKLFFTGNGRAKKADMVTFARAYGFRVQTDNEADAVALWFYLIDKQGSPAQRQQFRQMHFETNMGREQRTKF